MAVTVAAVVEEVFTAAAVASMEAAAMAVAVSAAARPPLVAIAAAISEVVAGQEACAVDFRPRHVVPAQAGLGPSRVAEAAAAWPDPADRVLPTGSGIPSEAPTPRSEQASIVAVLSHLLPGAVETGAAAVSAGVAVGDGVAVGGGADAGVGAAGVAVGDGASVSAGLPFGIGHRTATTPGWTTIIPGPISTRSFCGRDICEWNEGYFAGSVLAGCVMSSRMLSINRVLPT